jgi:beta-glucanase (GH16 family)
MRGTGFQNWPSPARKPAVAAGFERRNTKEYALHRLFTKKTLWALAGLAGLLVILSLFIFQPGNFGLSGSLPDVTASAIAATSEANPAGISTTPVPPSATPQPTPTTFAPMLAAPDGQRWVFAWGDEFDGAAVDSAKWAIQNKTRPDDPNPTYYLPRNVSVSDGFLTLLVKKEPHDGADYTGGMLESTGAYRHELYGYYEARVKNSLTGPGFWTNFWMCGVKDWPPEFDQEIVSNRPGSISQAHHYVDENGEPQTVELNVPIDYGDWHVYGIRWLPNEPVSFYIDGSRIFTSTAPLQNPPDESMYVILRAGAYYDSYWGGKPNATTAWPGAVQYDWVRVYRAQ